MKTFINRYLHIFDYFLITNFWRWTFLEESICTHLNFYSKVLNKGIERLNQCPFPQASYKSICFFTPLLVLITIILIINLISNNGIHAIFIFTLVTSEIDFYVTISHFYSFLYWKSRSSDHFLIVLISL